MGIIEPGDKYGLDQMLDDPDNWMYLSKGNRGNILKATENILGVGLTTIHINANIRTYHESGVPGTPTEQGADVIILETNRKKIELHVYTHTNPRVGNRYDLVITNNN